MHLTLLSLKLNDENSGLSLQTKALSFMPPMNVSSAMNVRMDSHGIVDAIAQVSTTYQEGT